MVSTRVFGDTGITVSQVGLGAWQLGRSAHWPDGPDEAEAVGIVHAALDAGVTFIDTAPGYADGRSESTIGRALRGGRRDQVVLCTKVGHTPDGGTDWRSSSIEASVRGSAERLGTDHLDVVLLHSPPPEILDGTRSDHYEVLDRLRDQGLVRAFGCSVDTSHDVDTVLRTSPSTALEVRFSALYQEPGAALGRAHAAGLGTVVKIPLESGWLSGRYTASSAFSGVRSRWSADDVAVRAGLVDEFRALLPAGVTVLQGALQFVLAQESVSTVIPGVRSVGQLQGVVAAAAGTLPAENVRAIEIWYEERVAGRPLDW
ncbi:MAG TPA: aldo/keto reductase [Actinotalea sp.]